MSIPDSIADVLVQLLWLITLAIPVACISWTVTHEEIFRPAHEYLVQRSKVARSVIVRKFCYMLTCEYCFSHYVTIAILIVSHYTLLLPGWKGYLIAGFSIVWMANIYMSLYNLIRTDIKKENLEAKQKEHQGSDLPESWSARRKTRRRSTFD